MTEFGGPAQHDTAIHVSVAGSAVVPEGMQMARSGNLPHVFENPAAAVGPGQLQGRVLRRVTPLCLEDFSPRGCANGTVCGFIPPTPSPTTAHCLLSGACDHGLLPRLLGSPDNNGARVGSRPSPKAPKGLQLQPTTGICDVNLEALSFGDVEGSMPIGKTDSTLAGRGNAPTTSLLTPSTASMLSVHNTFLHFSLPMASPSITGNCRRRSLSQ
jgi:hypothetical protein